MVAMMATRSLRAAAAAATTLVRSGLQLGYQRHGVPLDVLSLAPAQVEVRADGVLLEYIQSPINPADINQIEGVYPKSPSLPAVGGNEGLARVLHVGPSCTNSLLREGGLVIPKHSCLGTWQQLAAVGEDDVFPIIGNPSIGNGLTQQAVNNDAELLSQLATVSVNPSTAFRMLRDFVNLTPGDTVIQNGATSAVGQAVIQLCKAWGIHTINVIRHATKTVTDENGADVVVVDAHRDKSREKYLRDLGATEIIYDDALKAEDTRALIKSYQPLLAFNCVGGQAAMSLCRILPSKATIVTYGGMSKRPLTVATGSLIFKDHSFRGFWMTRWNDEAMMRDRCKMLAELLDLIHDGALRTNVELHGINDWEGAIRASQAPYRLAKQVLTF